MSIVVRGLDFRYKDFGLSVEELAFEASKMTSIVGPNGAGKSTLLKCLAAVLPVSRQTLFLDGRDLASLKAADRARLISYVPQEQALALNYSAFDFVLMGRAPFISAFSVPSREDAEA
ncbi:MAG TPA: ABC transporter ATP-binding protein, partial [Candidatus Aminicenantes bacterium]|nr:ABC transporter ATP-binding protein [Candidatus Aminicenantes bacterium]